MSASRPVWLVWAVTLAGILAAIVRDGRNVPFEEDWLMVAAMTGHEPDLPQWLWSQNSEHRLPLPRLVNLGLLGATGDLRATMVFDTLALAALAAGMILVARRLRGRTSLADAFFPLLMLHLGNWDNLLWAWQIQFVLPTVLAGTVLLAIVARPTLATPWTACGGGLALVCLPLSGANGLLLAPPLAAWFIWQTWAGRGEPGAPAAFRRAAGLAGCLTLLLCGLYFMGYESSPWNAPSPGPGATLVTAGKFLGLSLGPVAAHAWLLFGGAVAFVFLCALVAAVLALENPADRRRALGVLAFLAAALAMALAVGWGRAGRAAETGRMPSRYVLLAAPGMCAAYFALLLYGTARSRRLLPLGLAILAALLFPLNTREGLKRRDWFGAGMRAFEEDLDAGASAAALAREHHPFLLHWDEPLMVTGLRQLHEAGVGPFRAWDPEGTGSRADVAP